MEHEGDHSGATYSTITFRTDPRIYWRYQQSTTPTDFHFTPRLKRVYILFNAKHGLNDFDSSMLAHLTSFLMNDRGVQPFTLQSVITKADTVPVDELQTRLAQMKKDIWAAAPLCLPPLVTSSEMSPPFGIEDVRQNIASACGFR